MFPATLVHRSLLAPLVAALLLLLLPARPAAGQDAEYADWSFSGGTGTFSTYNGMPNFTYTVTGDQESYEVDGSSTFDAMGRAATGWDEEFTGNFSGDTLDAESLQVDMADPSGVNDGESITQQAVITIDFDSPTPSAGWGILVMDLEIDQVSLEAFGPPRGNRGPTLTPIPASTLNSWFQDVFDADNSANTDPGDPPATRPPAYDPNPGAVAPGVTEAVAIVGNSRPAPDRGPPPGPNEWQETFSTHPGDEAGAGWFLPDEPVSRLVLRYENWHPDSTASFHLFIAANAASPVELMSFGIE